MGKCTKCGTNFIGTAESIPPDGLCRYCEVSKLKDTLDMQRDEFKRIIALMHPPRFERHNEIVGICLRAVDIIEQTVPVVVQRDNLQKQNARLRSALVGIVGEDRPAELREMAEMLNKFPIANDERERMVIGINLLLETQP